MKKNVILALALLAAHAHGDALRPALRVDAPRPQLLRSAPVHTTALVSARQTDLHSATIDRQRAAAALIAVATATSDAPAANALTLPGPYALTVEEARRRSSVVQKSASPLPSRATPSTTWPGSKWWYVDELLSDPNVHAFTKSYFHPGAWNRAFM